MSSRSLKAAPSSPTGSLSSSLKSPASIDPQQTMPDPKKLFEIDFTGIGTFQQQHNILQKKSVELVKTQESRLSARGLQHRPLEHFSREVQNTTAYIVNFKRTTSGSDVAQSAIHLLNAHFQRALAYERVGCPDKAIEDYNTCLEINENHAPSYFNRSGLLGCKGDLVHAYRDIDKAVQLDPGNVSYRNNKAILLRRKGDYEEAIKETMIFRAIQSQPNLLKDIFAGVDIQLDEDALSAALQVKEDPIFEALRQPVKCRTTNVDDITDFLKTVKIFKPFAKEVQVMNRVAQRVVLEQYKKGKVVFQEGAVGDRFYIVLDGEVSIVKLVKDKKGGIVEAKTLVKLFRGDNFGETALDHVGGLRSAGAVATADTNLLSLSVDHYHSVINRYKSVIQQEVQYVLSTSTVFADWEPEQIEMLAGQAVLQSYAANSELLRAGDPVKTLYIIKHGVASLVKMVDRSVIRGSHSSQFVHPDSAGCIETPGLWVLDKNWKVRMDTFDQSNSETKVSRGPAPSLVNRKGHAHITENAADYTDKEEFTVGVLGSGQVFGELAILDPAKPSPVSVYSCTNIELYCFNSDLLLALGARFDASTVNSLNESLNLCNPPGDKVAYYFRAKLEWERRKAKLLLSLGHTGGSSSGSAASSLLGMKQGTSRRARTASTLSSGTGLGSKSVSRNQSTNNTGGTRLPTLKR